jgi:hypothetical protein
MPMDKGHENFARRRDQHELDDDAAAGDDRGLGPTHSSDCAPCTFFFGWADRW